MDLDAAAPVHTINTPLLRKTLEHITEHPDEWNQGFWAVNMPCGTQYCLAGHAVLLSGQDVDWDTTRDVRGHQMPERATNGRSIQSAARVALGLSEAQAFMLFHDYNSLQYLWRSASEFTDGEIETPEEFK